MDRDFSPATEYQAMLLQESGNHVVPSGRQTGKTEFIARRTGMELARGNDVVAIAPAYRMMHLMMDRIRARADLDRSTKVMGEKNDAKVHVFSATMLDDDKQYRQNIGQIDATTLLVDEAAFMENRLIMKLDRENFVNKFYMFTPNPAGHIVQMWAEYGPFHETTHVPIGASPFINRDFARDHRKDLSEPKARREHDAVYWSGDNPAQPPENEF